MTPWTRVGLRCLLLVASCVLAVSSDAQAADPSRGEIHVVRTTTLTDEQFLAGVREGTPTTVAGELRFPAGKPATERLPVMVLVHGSGGIGPGLYQWAREFNDLGLATFMIDSFTGRGLTSVREEQEQLGLLTTLVDVYRALEILSQHPRIDSKRIGIIGGSRGALPALYTSLRRFQRMHGSTGAEFALHLVFYPNCATTYVDELDVVDHPIRIFHGGADEAAASCRPYAERLRKAGKDVVFTEYPGAHHAFAEPVGKIQVQGQTRRDCPLEERAAGTILNRATGKPFTWNDACVRRGPITFETNPRAREDAFAKIKETLARTFNIR